MSIYNNVHPDHPLNAFISSLCDDDFAKTPDEYQKRKKYCVIRRELQLLLESTHLFIIYNFDEEYASSRSTRNQYLHYLDRCDLVVFLIDNKDGISDGVRKEYKEAIEKNKNCYYIICNHDDAPKTEIQEKLESSAIDKPRFKAIKEFEKAAEVAYKSVMSDLIFHYQFEDEKQKKNAPSENILDASNSISSFSVVNTASLEVFESENESDLSDEQVSETQAVSLRGYFNGDKATCKADITAKSEKASEVVDENQSPKVRQDSRHSKNHKTYNFHFDKRFYDAPKELATYLYDCMVLGGPRAFESKNANKTRTTPIVADTLQFLSTLIGRSAFENDSFDNLTNLIIDKQDTLLKPIVAQRLFAIKSYHYGNVQDAIDHIHRALDIAIEINKAVDFADSDKSLESKDPQIMAEKDKSSSIPEWILNDIALDLRNMISINAKIENNLELGFGIGNEGQQILDDSSETVYYPLIDRNENYFYEKIIERYEKNYLQSPYTVIFGSSFDRVFKFIADIYWIALLNGSFTQVEITSQRLITALRMLVNTYDDHLPVVELFRLILIRNEKIKENIGNILRTYHGDTDILNAQEAKSIFQSIEWMPIDILRNQAEFEFVANFSCYCDDELFKKCIIRPLDNTLSWAKNPKRIYLNDEDKFRFYDGLINRGLPGKMVDFALTLFENTKALETLTALKRDVCKHLRNIDYSQIDKTKVDKLLNELIPMFSLDDSVDNVDIDNNIVEGETEHTGAESGKNDKSTSFHRSLTIEFKDNQYLIGVLIQIALSAPEYKERIKDVIKVAPAEYVESFNLEIDVSEYKNDKSIDIYKYIKSYLDAGHANAKAAKNGTLTEGVNYYEVIRNIIESTNVELTNAQVEEIIKYALTFLSVTKQRVGQRVTCCEVLSLLICRYKKAFDWKSLSRLLYEKKNELTEAESDFFFHDSPIQLQCAYIMLLTFGGYAGNDVLISILSSIGNEQEYVRIRCLEILTENLKIDNGGKLRKAVVNTISTFTLFSSGTHERDTKYNCVKCLIELTRYAETKDIALRQLMLFMDSGMAEIRLATVARVKDSKFKHNPYVDAIMGKARVDHHYLVRKAVESAD